MVKLLYWYVLIGGYWFPRRQIEADHEKETQDLQKSWMELRHVVRYVYREAGTGLAQTQDSNDNNAIPDVSKMKELVHR